MAPSDKKEFQKFWDLIFKAILWTNGTSSWLGPNNLLRPKALSLQESIMEHFACPKGKQIGQVVPYDMSVYL
jgi:hypothetical protein